MQFAHDLTGVARLRTRLAPAIPGAVIAASPRVFGYPWLNKSPYQRGRAQPAFENDRWPACNTLAGAVDMQAIAAQVNQPAGWRKGMSVIGAGDGLIQETYSQKRQLQGQNTEGENGHTSHLDGKSVKFQRCSQKRTNSFI